MSTAKSIYRTCVGFEEKAAWIYLKLASHFSSNPGLSTFWLEMGMQEKQHAGLLQFCLNEGLFARDLPKGDQITRIGRQLRDLEKRASDPKLTIEKAFALAIKMESSEINAIYSHLSTSGHSSTYLLKRRIATYVPNHLQDLIDAARKFGIAEKTLERVSRMRHVYRQTDGLVGTHK